MSNARTRYCLNSRHDEDGGRSGNYLDHGDGDIAKGEVSAPHLCQFHDLSGSLVARLCNSRKVRAGLTNKG